MQSASNGCPPLDFIRIYEPFQTTHRKSKTGTCSATATENLFINFCHDGNKPSLFAILLVQTRETGGRRVWNWKTIRRISKKIVLVYGHLLHLHVDRRPRLRGVIGSSITLLSSPLEQDFDSMALIISTPDSCLEILRLSLSTSKGSTIFPCRLSRHHSDQMSEGSQVSKRSGGD